jgi:hypothetical protein
MFHVYLSHVSNQTQPKVSTLRANNSELSKIDVATEDITNIVGGTDQLLGRWELY